MYELCVDVRYVACVDIFLRHHLVVLVTLFIYYFSSSSQVPRFRHEELKIYNTNVWMYVTTLNRQTKENIKICFISSTSPAYTFC